MTLIELFEQDSVEDVCSSIAFSPERVILVGSRAAKLQQRTELYRKLLGARGMSAEISWKLVGRNNLGRICQIISDIVGEYGDCEIDLTGGEDLCLTAAGVLFSRLGREKLQLHRYNIDNNKVYDCDQDGELIAVSPAPALTVRENILIYGGGVSRTEHEKRDFPTGPEATDQRRDILSVWGVSIANLKDWNFVTAALGACKEMDKDGDPLTFSCPRKVLADKCACSIDALLEVLRELHGKQMIFDTVTEGETVSFRFGNHRIRRMITTAGNVLEQRIFLAALDAREDNGEPTYNDAAQGVSIDWNGADLSAPGVGWAETQNEIDVMMMHGMIPVFVSCKNGQVSQDELYKLYTVAARFGGKHAKKVLIATSLGNDPFAKSLKKRANEMGIRLESRLADKSAEELDRAVRSFWSN